MIAGQLFLKTPHENEYLDADATFLPHCFESKQPPWLDMSEPNSLASWILYYMERAIFIQFEANVYGKFVSQKDQNKQPLFIGIDGKYISIQNELKPFWRTFCEERDSIDDLLKAVKESCYSQLGLSNQEIDKFNGWISDGFVRDDPHDPEKVARVIVEAHELN